MNYSLPLEQFFKMAQRYPNEPYLHQPILGELNIYSWLDVEKDARTLAANLYKMDLKIGDRVGILSKNCAEWFIVDLAIMMAGMISVPIYHTANRKTIQYIIKDSGCKVVCVGKLDDFNEAENGINPEIIKIIFASPNIEGQYQWKELLNGEKLTNVYRARAHDILSIVYTSGSTGNPKGVVLTHNNIATASYESAKVATITPDDHLISYLPLAHIVERTLIEIASFYSGSKVFFVESLDTFMNDIKVAQPNVFLSVPRLWCKFQSEILNKISDKKLQVLLKIPFIKKLVRKKIRKSLGLDNTRILGSGSAAISPEIILWYQKLGLNISDGWGMTETAGTFCVNLPFDKSAIGTIGKPLVSSEIKIGEYNEVLVRGLSIFKEYYNNPINTEKYFSDGWFHTGDMGEILADGNVRIIGRIKEQFKTSKGKYISPALIETMFAKYTTFEQICVIGQGRKQPVALVQINTQNNNKNTLIDRELQLILKQINARLENHQKLDNIVVIKEDWTVDNNMLTPTLKIKRREIEAKYKHYLSQDFSTGIYWEQ